MKKGVHLWQYLSEFFLELEMLQAEFIEKIKTHIACAIIFFSFLKIVPFMR